MALEGMLRLPGWHGRGSVERVDRKEWVRETSDGYRTEETCGTGTLRRCRWWRDYPLLDGTRSGRHW